MAGVDALAALLAAARRTCVAVAFAFLAMSGSAQDTWTPQDSGTERDLHGVTFGNGQFVAVGKGGVVLVSSDGVRWSTANAGTSRDLFAVAYVDAHFVAVGDAGTVLVSKDTMQWRQVDIVTGDSSRPYAPRRLYALIANGFGWSGEGSSGSVTAVGDDGTWVSGSPVAQRWAGFREPVTHSWRGIALGRGEEVVVGPQGISPGRFRSQLSYSAGELNAVTFARGEFVAVGQDGLVVSSRDGLSWNEARAPVSNLLGVGFFNNEFVGVGEDGGVLISIDARSWVRVTTARSALRAVATTPSLAVAVGQGGTVMRSTARPRAPQIVAAPEAAETRVGGAAGFRVIAAGSPPLAYQWFRDGQMIASATMHALMLPKTGLADAGIYRVEVSNAVGTILSAPVALAVGPGAEIPIVDERFRADPGLDIEPLALLPMADGGIVVAGRSVVRLRSDGGIDSTFHRGMPAVDEFEPTVLGSVVRPRVTQVLGLSAGRLLVVGNFRTFNGAPRMGIVRLFADGTVDETFAAPPEHFAPTTADFSGKAALQPDGKIIVLTAARRVIRLLPDGALDSTFTPQLATEPLWNSIAVAADGRVFVGSFSRTLTDGWVVALQPNGAADPTFVPYQTASVEGLYPRENGDVLVAAQIIRSSLALRPPSMLLREENWTFRLRRDGSLDPAFGIVAAKLAAPPAANGDMLIADRLIMADGSERRVNLGVRQSFPDVAVLEPGGRLWVGGRFTIYNGVATTNVVRLNLVASETTVAPRLVAVWADTLSATFGDAITVRVAATGPGPLTYEWTISSEAVPRITSEPWVSFIPRFFSAGASYSVRVRNSAGEATSARERVELVPGALRIVAQPQRVDLTTGKSGRIEVTLDSSSVPVRAEWRRNGASIPTTGPGAIRDPGFLSLFIERADPAYAGTYTVTITDLLGSSTTSHPIDVGIDRVARFSNLSTRTFVGGGDAAAILGFTIPAGSPRTVQVRGIGPALRRFSVTGTLSQPQLDVFAADGRVVGRSNGWERSISSRPPDLFERVGAFALEPGDQDAALLLTLESGSYTARLSGAGGAGGEGLIELYEDDTRSERLSNVSSRVLVAGGPTGVAIAGFTIVGAISKRVLLRVGGPALMAFGISDTLPNPRLELRDAAGRVVATNDDWGRADNGRDSVALQNVSLLTSAATRVGAFPFMSGSKDAALLTTLAPGSYSLVASDVGLARGVALVEIYEVED